MSRTFVENISWGNPAHNAVADDHSTLTYGELRTASEKIAGLIRRRYGVQRYLLVRSWPSSSFVCTTLGVMLSGNTPIPIDPNTPAELLDYMRGKSAAAEIIQPFEQSDYQSASCVAAPDSSMPALIMYTSGTSGFPKGVIISHDNLLHSCLAISEYLSYAEFPSAAVVLPLYYSYALLSQVFCQLYIGGFVRLFENLRNPIKIASAVTESRLMTFCGVPSTFHAMAIVHRLSPISFPTVRVVCSAGAAMDYARYADIKAMFPNSILFNNYGMTEAAPRISYVREDDPRFLQPTCGRPMAGVDVRVVDPLTHLPLPDGQQGVLVVRGPNVTSGYLNDPQQTAEAFTPDGFLVSGDIAYIDDGYIMICGRHDDIFNVGGEKVAPLEIERVLNRLPGVANSAVRGFEDEQRGMVPVAFLQLLDENVALSRRDLHAHLRDKLPASKIPQRFYAVRAFPTTSNGKLVRRKLAIDDAEYIVREIL